MRILFFGDVMGRSGRDALVKHLPVLQKAARSDVVIVNGENAAGGHGISVKIAQEFFALGVNCITTGNHVWKQKEILTSIGAMPGLLRPLNYPETTPGRGSYTFSLPDGRKILIVNLMGQMGIQPTLDDPFLIIDRFLSTQRMGAAHNAIFVDFHAEVTSEKVAMGQFLDGRVSAVIGTHTHIPTADARLLAKGTAFQTDVGMCGDFDSVIGMRKDLAVWRFSHKIPGERLVPAEGEATLCGVFIEIDDKTGLSRKIAPFQLGGCLQNAANTPVF